MLGLAGCVGIPDGVEAVRGFDSARYLGVWYEIARLDHSFERGLTRVTATYGARDDGGISVVNRGYDAAARRWKQVEGRAYLVGEPDVGQLKVSFFRPFYGSYNIIALDDAYTNALVCSADFNYLWILSRAPTQAKEVTAALVARAKALGFDTDALIFVDQGEVPAGPAAAP